MKYQYSPELKNVLQAFRDVKKSYSYRDLADGAPDPPESGDFVEC